MESFLFPLAFLFLLLLVINASFNLFCGLCILCVAGNNAITHIKKVLPTGVTAQVEDAEGKRYSISPDELERLKAQDDEINRMVERWTQI